MARRGLRRFPALGRADLGDDGGLEQRSPDPEFAAGMGFVVACAASCLCPLAICLRFADWRLRAFDGLSVNAYRMYLIHYVFAVWLQYALLGTGLFAIGKAAIVFGFTLIVSWAIASAMGGAVPFLRLNVTLRGVRRA